MQHANELRRLLLCRILALHPELVQNDTIRIQDTTIIPGVKIDTLVLFSQLKDTITITKKKLQVKLFAVNDTVYLWAEQKGDTVVVEKEVVVERVVLPKTNSIFFESSEIKNCNFMNISIYLKINFNNFLALYMFFLHLYVHMQK